MGPSQGAVSNVSMRTVLSCAIPVLIVYLTLWIRLRGVLRTNLQHSPAALFHWFLGLMFKEMSELTTAVSYANAHALPHHTFCTVSRFS